MPDPARSPNAQGRLRAWFWRLRTGTKAFLILSVALLPLAIIGVAAVLQTTRASGEVARAQLRIAAAESARRLAIELNGDLTALRSAMATLTSDPLDTPACARLTGTFAAQYAQGTRFGIVDGTGKLLCGNTVDARILAPAAGEALVRIVDDRGLLMAIGGPREARANVFFPTGFLDTISRPGVDLVEPGTRLTDDGGELILRSHPNDGPLQRLQRVITPIGVGALTLEVEQPVQTITSPLLVAMVLPLLMWAAAAGIAWFAVNRLFIRPLRALQADIAAYTPGEVLVAGRASRSQAREIRELHDTFLDLSRTVSAHEQELADGLVRQTKLTKEVHHRVKNNLQVIASLTSIHARSATSDDVLAAYASIQRRVDALAVVHRNHFAEMEVNRGLALRTMIGELAANLRATAPAPSQGMSIALEVAPFLVSQDTALAIAFLLTELIELAMTCDPVARIVIGARTDTAPDRAILRLSSTALIDSDRLNHLIDVRYGRVLTGLGRQLRAQLHHDPLQGSYEISVAILGIE